MSVSFFNKIKYAQDALELFEELKKSDNDGDGKADYMEDWEDLKAIEIAVQHHDAASVLEHVEAIIRRSGPDIAKLRQKFKVA